MALVQLIPHRARPFDDRNGGLPAPARAPWTAGHTLLVLAGLAVAIALVGIFLPPEPARLETASPEAQAAELKAAVEQGRALIRKQMALEAQIRTEILRAQGRTPEKHR